MIFIFKFARTSFKISYYISSLLPAYALIVIYMLVVDYKKCISTINPQYHIVFVMFVLLLFISITCLCMTHKILLNVNDYSKTLGTIKIKLKNEYNSGVREFILSLIIPMISTFSIKESPIATFIMISIIQLFIGYFFINSSDFFPNISLSILGYSFFIADNSSSDDIRIRYVFGKNKIIDEILEGNDYFQVVGIGEDSKTSVIGIINEKDEK